MVAVLGDEHLGMSWAEIFSIPQLQIQLPAIILVHGLFHFLLTRWKTGPFASRAGYTAHYIPFIVCFFWMAVYGVYLWLYDEQLADPSFDRIWGAHEGATTLVISMLSIQLYDLPISFVIPDLRQVTFILHHAVVLTLAFIALRYRAFLYYGVYFFGVIESSSPFLAMVDGFRDFPKLANKFAVTNELCRVGFAVVFYAVRIIAWVPVSIGFWRDAFRLLSGEVPMHTMPKYIVCFWLFVHLGLTLLQWHWGIIIAKGAYYMAIGDTSARENEAKGA